MTSLSMRASIASTLFLLLTSISGAHAQDFFDELFGGPETHHSAPVRSRSQGVYRDSHGAHTAPAAVGDSGRPGRRGRAGGANLSGAGAATGPASPKGRSPGPAQGENSASAPATAMPSL
jgi:hypothetical protein